ncbi:hypothetical protein KO498_03625 [Lentibacter algarum]|uniref:hypothetical protein n=1 Tax=Lentibacter algarum TaxID=576131 RepID=UPI001C06CA75|nr:hypothetical protein [Lentibacter algarum]MBU2980896.1 hypothetical protein [Lentibacter algarum]
MSPLAPADCLLEARPYEPFVTREGAQLVYHLPVESSVVSKMFSFEITEDEFGVLDNDAPRFYFLFALLHEKYQYMPPTGETGYDKLFPRVLLGSGRDVEALLTHADKAANGAIAAHVADRLGADFDALREGVWFQI